MSTPRLQMVVGLAFDPTRNMVVMVHKQTGPQCVIGNWNGVGGKIDPGETPIQAMRREFREETGVDLSEDYWTQFAMLIAEHYDLFFFWAESDSVFSCRTMEKEPIKLWLARDLMQEANLMGNMRWMVPFIQDREMAHDLGSIRIHR